MVSSAVPTSFVLHSHPRLQKIIGYHPFTPNFTLKLDPTLFLLKDVDFSKKMLTLPGGKIVSQKSHGNVSKLQQSKKLIL